MRIPSYKIVNFISLDISLHLEKQIFLSSVRNTLIWRNQSPWNCLF